MPCLPWVKKIMQSFACTVISLYRLLKKSREVGRSREKNRTILGLDLKYETPI